MRPKNVKALYDKIAVKYHQNRSKAPNDYTELPKIIELAGNVKSKKVLDLGCGTGKHAKEYLKKGAILTGVDVSEKMIELAKKSCKNQGEFLLADFEKIKFEKESFDLINASFSLHYSKNLNHLFKQFNSWLKPNGRVIFSISHPMQYYLKIKDFDFSKSKKYWFRLNTYDVEVFNYYHPIGKYCESFISNGFQLNTFVETIWTEKKHKIPNAVIFEIIKIN